MKELTTAAMIENIENVTSFVEAELEALCCPLKVVTQIDIAIDEIFSNIAHYAYSPGQGSATVRIDFDEEEQAVLITFMDSGKQFDPLAKEDPDITLSAGERSIGGLGIYMVKQIMDDVTYQYSGGQNILTIKKYFE